MRSAATDDLTMAFMLSLGRLRQARQIVRDERDLLSVLFDSVGVAVIACAIDGRVTHANSCARELIGATGLIGLDAELRIEQLLPRTPEGSPLSLDETPLMRARHGETVCDVDVLTQTARGDVLLSASAHTG